MQYTLEQLLKSMKDYKGSDLHLNIGREPMMRIDGKLTPLNLPKLTKDDIARLCYSILTEKQKAIFEEELELDFSFDIPRTARFRANYFYEKESVAAVFRIIPEEPLSLKDINAPEVFRKLVDNDKGLILITGATGSGKTTTSAAMIREINENYPKHILTIEDPIEFTHEHKKSLVSQREVGRDTKAFARALKAALREDPDVIFIGEMRDKETIAAAITAAETGHLVIGTLHTNSAPQTINRIVNVFSAEEQDQIRTQLSMALLAVISQALLPRIGGGRVAAHEILVNTPAIANLIRENKIQQIYSQMQLNQAQTGMQTLNQVLAQLIRRGLIEVRDAMAVTTKPEELRKLIGF